MHDKQIRRRRAVLALLVVVSLILLTDYFGESSTSPLHSVQQSVADVISPIQDGASKIFSPVRDVTGWISSTIHAKSQVSELKQELAQQKGDIGRGQYDEAQYKEDQRMLKLRNFTDRSQYDPVAANVIGKNPLLWYDTITVNRGTSAGIKQYDPVVGEGGLVGRVSVAGPDYSVIMLITSPQFFVGAMVENVTDSAGVLRPADGNPSTLLLSYLPSNSQITYNQEVVTSGFKDTANPTVQSYAPPGIPIGTVSNENTQTTVLNDQQVTVRPSADIQQISVVQILTKPHGGQ